MPPGGDEQSVRFPPVFNSVSSWREMDPAQQGLAQSSSSSSPLSSRSEEAEGRGGGPVGGLSSPRSFISMHTWHRNHLLLTTSSLVRPTHSGWHLRPDSVVSLAVSISTSGPLASVSEGDAHASPHPHCLKTVRARRKRTVAAGLVGDATAQVPCCLKGPEDRNT